MMKLCTFWHGSVLAGWLHIVILTLWFALGPGAGGSWSDECDFYFLPFFRLRRISWSYIIYSELTMDQKRVCRIGQDSIAVSLFVNRETAMLSR